MPGVASQTRVSGGNRTHNPHANSLVHYPLDYQGTQCFFLDFIIGIYKKILKFLKFTETIFLVQVSSKYLNQHSKICEISNILSPIL